MACKKEGVPFSGTPEQEAALKKVIACLLYTSAADVRFIHRQMSLFIPARETVPDRLHGL